jgi:hypothetical protein
VSRTLVSVSVSSPRPNIADRATAISFFARGADRKAHWSDARHLKLEQMCRRQQLSTERSGRLGVEQPRQLFPRRLHHVSSLALAMFLPRPDCSGGRRGFRWWSLFGRRPSGRFWRPNGVAAEAGVVTGARAVANFAGSASAVGSLVGGLPSTARRRLTPRGPPHRSIGGPFRCSDLRIC